MLIERQTICHYNWLAKLPLFKNTAPVLIQFTLKCPMSVNASYTTPDNCHHFIALAREEVMEKNS